MRIVRRTKQFKRDVKRMQRRGKRFDIFKAVIQKIAMGQPLESRYRDHSLTGQYTGTWECHIQPDWLLIYETNGDEVVLIRTGTHSDLFK